MIVAIRVHEAVCSSDGKDDFDKLHYYLQELPRIESICDDHTQGAAITI